MRCGVESITQNRKEFYIENFIPIFFSSLFKTNDENGVSVKCFPVK